VGVLHQHLVSHANVADSDAQAQDLEKKIKECVSDLRL
jgi:hypothetical protein